MIRVWVVAEQHVPVPVYGGAAAHGDLPELSEELACFPGFEPCRIMVAEYERTMASTDVQPVQ